MSKRPAEEHATPAPGQAAHLPPAPSEAGFWKQVALLTLLGAAVAACVWLLLPASARPRPKPAPKPNQGPAWQPSSDEDRIVAAFRAARNEDAAGGKTLLAADPAFDENVPVSEQHAEALRAGYFLHRARKVLSIRGGEPAPGGNWRNTPGRYTLATRVDGSTPPLRIQSGKGVGSPSRLFLINPDIVVEVRDGKLHALRAELHAD